tara:strand:- start:53 stop:691 length:639 start_codon:yes stop_codon:yes gene_type:complete
MAKKKDDEELTPSEKKLARTKAKTEIKEKRGDSAYTQQFYKKLQRLETAPDATAAGSAIRQLAAGAGALPVLSMDLLLGKVRKKIQGNPDISKAEEKRLVKMYEDRMKTVGGKSGRPSPLTRKGRDEKAAVQEAILSGQGVRSAKAGDRIMDMDPDEYDRRISTYQIDKSLKERAYKKGGKVKTKPTAKLKTIKKFRGDGIASRGKTRGRIV